MSFRMLVVQGTCGYSVHALAMWVKCIAAQIYGIRFGLRGFYSRTAKPVELNQKRVDGIHLTGGTILV